MAIEQGIGAGGITEEPIVEDNTRMMEIPELPVNPGITEFDDGSAVIGEYEEETEALEEIEFDGNLADIIDEDELSLISSNLVGSIEDDLSARQDWEDTYKKGLEFLGMKTEERSEPFEGSSGVIHPLLAESVTQFQAQAYRELLPATGPVRSQVVGAQNEMLVRQAERVKDYMNYMITYEMEEYDPELDQMLFYLPVIGSTFKKVYNDPLKQRAVSSFVHAEDMIVPYGATDLSSSPRITHRLTMDSNEIRKLQLAGFYRDDIDLPSESGGGDLSMGEVEESIDDMYLVSDQQCNSRLVRSDKHGTGILLNRPYYDEHSDMVAAMRRASDILLNILDYIDAGRLRADIFDPDSQTVTLKSLNNSGRIIQGVTALGEDGAKPLAASMQVTSIFHSSLALMALLSFPSHYDFSAGCDHPDHPVVGSCSGCDMKLHYFNFDANSEYEKYLVGLSFNLSEDDLARRAEFMMPIISERVELEKNGLMYGDIHIRFQHEDTAQDMKRYVSNRNYRFGVGLHANSCYLCGADSAHYESDLGTFEMPDADEYARRLQVGKEIIRRGG